MKTNILALSLVATGLMTTAAFAGNKDRSGQAGATELLINPYSRSSGMAGANMSSVKGLEAQYLNVAGLAHTQKTELIFSRTSWLRGSGININTFGFSQRVGESGVMGVGFMSMNFGKIPITTVNSPEGGLGTFSPNYSNINFSYAKEFSNSIYGGVNAKVISQTGAANIKAQGFALDAGIQYQTTMGKKAKANEAFKNNVHFGISLKNVGAPMKFNGDGIAAKASLFETGSTLTMYQRSAKFELPSLLNIGGAYDYYLLADKADHRITAAANFVANSFMQNQFQTGLEYGFKNMFMGRLGYNFEKDIFDEALSTNVYTGLTAGFTVELPISKSGSTFGLDYSYRGTNRFSGTHNLGVRINL